MPNQATAEKDSAAGVSPAAPWRVKAISIVPDYRLAVTFNDDTSGIADLSSVTKAKDASIYSALADPIVFEQATISLGVVTWPNGADLDSAWMYERLRKEKAWSLRTASPSLDTYTATRLRDARFGRAVSACASCAKASMLARALLTASDVGNAF